MPIHTVKLPDVGEGVAEAEIVEWHVKEGDLVREDDILAAVMTGKATVEIPSPVEGTITWLGAAMGDVVAVGTPILKIDYKGDAETDEPPVEEVTPTPMEAAAIEGDAEKAADAAREAAPERMVTRKPETPPKAVSPTAARSVASHGPPRPLGERPLASPAVRLRAKEAGVDLRQVPATGPAGRITHEDLDLFMERGSAAAAPGTVGPQPDTSVKEIRMVGLRRRIAEKMSLAKRSIPHITYVEEVDLTALEELRANLNRSLKPGRVKLTILPFLMRAIVRAVAQQPIFNARFDDQAGIIHQYGGVHIGIAAQTPSGLMVPVVRHAEARDIHDCAREIVRLSEAARAGTALREELEGSTITISSLGALGGIVSTPVINHPEVAIIGVNKMAVRPHWDGAQFVPRKMMNLSSSFDHRVIDGHDAATFIQRIKSLLETPAMIFVED
jgi:2-oxoisovalerate dehydrogenase E2 component (dihydrolipoyl transacylase)